MKSTSHIGTQLKASVDISPKSRTNTLPLDPSVSLHGWSRGGFDDEEEQDPDSYAQVAGKFLKFQERQKSLAKKKQFRGMCLFDVPMGTMPNSTNAPKSMLIPRKPLQSDALTIKDIEKLMNIRKNENSFEENDSLDGGSSTISLQSFLRGSTDSFEASAYHIPELTLNMINLELNTSMIGKNLEERTYVIPFHLNLIDTKKSILKGTSFKFTDLNLGYFNSTLGSWRYLNDEIAWDTAKMLARQEEGKIRVGYTLLFDDNIDRHEKPSIMTGEYGSPTKKAGNFTKTTQTQTRTLEINIEDETKLKQTLKRRTVKATSQRLAPRSLTLPVTTLVKPKNGTLSSSPKGATNAIKQQELAKMLEEKLIKARW